MQTQVDEFLDYLATEKGSSENTLAAYRNDLTQFTLYLTEQASASSWSDVNQAQIVNYILHMKELEYASSTVARKVAAVKSFFHYLRDEGVIAADPTLTRGGPPGARGRRRSRRRGAPTRAARRGSADHVRAALSTRPRGPVRRGRPRRARAERLRRVQRGQAEAAKQRFEQRTLRLLREAEAAAEAHSQRLRRVSGAAAAALAKAKARRGGNEGDGAKAPGAAE